VAFGLVALALTACGTEDQSEGLIGTRLVINEACPRNGGFWEEEDDDFGEFDDWIELYNGEDHEIRLGGYFLSNNPHDTLKMELSNELVIAPKEVLVLWADGQPQQGPIHLDFKLRNQDGQGIFLTDPSGRLIDHVTLYRMFQEESFARIPNGTGPMQLCELPTPGTKNVCWEGHLGDVGLLEAGAGGSGAEDEG